MLVCIIKEVSVYCMYNSEFKMFVSTFFFLSLLHFPTGDMSWRIVSEPWEYGYAQHLSEEMPFKDQEQTMIEEVRCLVCLYCECTVV